MPAPWEIALVPYAESRCLVRTALEIAGGGARMIARMSAATFTVKLSVPAKTQSERSQRSEVRWSNVTEEQLCSAHLLATIHGTNVFERTALDLRVFGPDGDLVPKKILVVPLIPDGTFMSAAAFDIPPTFGTYRAVLTERGEERARGAISLNRA